MKLHRTFLLAIAAVALLAGGGCSNNTQGDDASPVYLTVEFTQLPLSQNVASGSFLQVDRCVIKNVPKIPGDVSSYLDVRLESYTVEWRRIDGGKTATAAESFGGAQIVPVGGTSTLTNYPFMTPAALLRPPLDQLFPYNGGVDRETGNTVIRQSAKVTFYGHTMSGQPVSGFGVFDMNFFYSSTARPPQTSSGRAR